MVLLVKLETFLKSQKIICLLEICTQNAILVHADIRNGSVERRAVAGQRVEPVLGDDAPNFR
jgi:hypothetical protein